MDLSRIDRSSSYYEMKYDWKPEKEKRQMDMYDAGIICLLIIYCIIIGKVVSK